MADQNRTQLSPAERREAYLNVLKELRTFYMTTHFLCVILNKELRKILISKDKYSEWDRTPLREVLEYFPEVKQLKPANIEHDERNYGWFIGEDKNLKRIEIIEKSIKSIRDEQNCIS